MGKTKKVVILPLVSKTAGKKNVHNSGFIFDIFQGVAPIKSLFDLNIYL